MLLLKPLLAQSAPAVYLRRPIETTQQNLCVRTSKHAVCCQQRLQLGRRLRHIYSQQNLFGRAFIFHACDGLTPGPSPHLSGDQTCSAERLASGDQSMAYSLPVTSVTSCWFWLSSFRGLVSDNEPLPYTDPLVCADPSSGGTAAELLTTAAKTKNQCSDRNASVGCFTTSYFALRLQFGICGYGNKSVALLSGRIRRPELDGLTTPTDTCLDRQSLLSAVLPSLWCTTAPTASGPASPHRNVTLRPFRILMVLFT